jgi:NMD protein affecting ribosome stability and mRNA decay
MMFCTRCGEKIEQGEEREHLGNVVCEDCYMDLLSPAKTCDPWAVYTAKSCTDQENADMHLNSVQQKILSILKETGGVEPNTLIKQLDIKPSDFERELAALRHMEKIRAELRAGKKMITLW